MTLNEPVLFVSGIDTNIGKSYAVAHLLRLLRASGKTAISQKMVQTGNVGRSEDVDLHRRLLGDSLDEGELLELTAPQIFSHPASPHLAAEMDGRPIDFDKIEQATEALSRRYDHVVLEGAGGLMVPLTRDYSIIDFIEDHRYPVSLVTGGRLGSLNHTLLSVEALLNRDIILHSLVYNPFFDEDEAIAEDTKAIFKEMLETYLPDTQFVELTKLEVKC